jgi:hypothetical protein
VAAEEAVAHRFLLLALDNIVEFLVNIDNLPTRTARSRPQLITLPMTTTPIFRNSRLRASFRCVVRLERCDGGGVCRSFLPEACILNCVCLALSGTVVALWRCCLEVRHGINKDT